MSPPEQKAIVVLGMHRSGTSAVCGMTTLLGASPPAQVLPPTADNPTGFWESPAVIDVNDALLRAAGGSWYDCMLIDSSQPDDAALRDARPQLAATLHAQFAAAPLFVVKDPRLCLLLNYWLPVLPQPSVLLVLRHPAEVVASMHRREAASSQVSAALWLHHMLEAELQSRGCPRAVLSYEHLVQDWRRAMVRAGAVAGIAWPNHPAHAMEDITRHVSAALRHHVASPTEVAVGAAPLSEWIAETWYLLRAIEQAGPEPAWLSSLDRVRAGFGIWRRSVAPRVMRAAAE